MVEKILTIKEIESNIKKINNETMYEIDRLMMMVDIQRSIIKIQQQKSKELEK